MTMLDAPSHKTHRSFRGKTSSRYWKFRPIDRNDRARILHLAEMLNARTRRPGQHGGCLKDSGLQLLRALLFQFLDCKTGRLDPSLERLAEATGHCRATIVAALKRLKQAGFVTWVQRVAFVNISGERRPQQISNAYRIGLGLLPAGHMPSECNAAYEAKIQSETTYFSFLPENQAPEDDGLKSALARLAKTVGWSDEKLNSMGLIP